VKDQAAVDSMFAGVESYPASTVRIGVGFVGILDGTMDALASLEVAVKLGASALECGPCKGAWCCPARQSCEPHAFVPLQSCWYWTASF